MFGLFRKQTKKNVAKASSIVTLSIAEMHCTSCALNIDGELEDIPGVISAKTSYARAKTVISYDPDQVQIPQLQRVIADLGYTATID